MLRTKKLLLVLLITKFSINGMSLMPEQCEASSGITKWIVVSTIGILQIPIACLCKKYQKPSKTGPKLEPKKIVAAVSTNPKPEPVKIVELVPDKRLICNIFDHTNNLSVAYNCYRPGEL